MKCSSYSGSLERSQVYRFLRRIHRVDHDGASSLTVAPDPHLELQATAHVFSFPGRESCRFVGARRGQYILLGKIGKDHRGIRRQAALLDHRESGWDRRARCAIELFYECRLIYSALGRKENIWGAGAEQYEIGALGSTCHFSC